MEELGVISSVASMVRLVLAIWLFARLLPHREPFVGLSMIVLSGIAVVTAIAVRLGFSIFPIIEGDFSFFVAILQLIAILAASVLLLMVPYAISIWTSLFCCSAGYALQSLAGGLDRLLTDLLSATGYTLTSAGFTITLEIVVTLVSYGACYLILVRRLEANRLMAIEDRSMLMMIAAVVLFDIVFDLVVRDLGVYGIPRSYFRVLCVVHIVACVFTLGMEFEILYNRRMELEVGTMTQMREMERQQYELSRETIGAINARCHKIRHQIFRLAHDSGLTDTIGPDALASIAREVSIYDSAIRTGNDALDTILSEKSLICTNAGITLSCIADGPSLRFMSPTDIYAIFGSALDGAISSVRTLDDTDRRAISLVVRRVGDMVTLHLEFYADEGARPTDGMGDKTMRSIVASYGGSLQTSLGDDARQLDIALPVIEQPRQRGLLHRGGPDSGL